MGESPDYCFRESTPMRLLSLLLLLVCAVCHAQVPVRIKVDGTIVTVDVEKRQVTYGARNPTLGFNKDSRVTLDGKPATVADLKPGQRFVALAARNGYCYNFDATSPPKPPPPPAPPFTEGSLRITPVNYGRLEIQNLSDTRKCDLAGWERCIRRAKLADELGNTYK